MSQGSQSAFYVEPGASPHTFDANSERYEFVHEGIVKTPAIVSTEGIRGTGQESKEQTREGAYTVGGPIVLNASPAMLDFWLSRAWGGTKAGNDIPYAETLPSFGVLLNKGEELFQYTDCQVNSLMLHGRAGPDSGRLELIECAVDIWGLTEVVGTSAPAVSITTTAISHDPYRMADCSLSINSSTREFNEFWFLIHRHLQRRWVNSLSATALTSRKTTVMLDVNLPFTSGTETLKDMSVGGVACTLTITNSTCSTTLAAGVYQTPVRTPAVVGKTETQLRCRGFFRKSGSTSALTITNDSTP